MDPARLQGPGQELALMSPTDQPSRHDAGRPLRIAVVASSYNYIKDGVALTLNKLVDYLERQGVEVLVFAPVGKVAAFEHRGTLVSVPSMPLPRRPEYRLTFGLMRRASERLRNFKPDIIHIALAPDPLGYSAMRFARRHKIPVVASYHTRYETYLKDYWYVAGLRGLMAAYLRRFYAACREVYVPSQSMMDTLLAEGLKNNFRLWPRGVDATLFSPVKRSGSWRAKHGIGESELVIAHISRLVREKRIDTVLAAHRLLEERGIAHRMLFVGDGPDRAELQKQLPQAVFTGFLDGDELATSYASSDIFVFASDTESFGNVTLEAMASGLPCVVADATGSRSLVLHGRTGFCARPGIALEFADALTTLAEDSALRRQMGIAARARSLEFSWDGTMARLHGYYQALLAEAAA